MGMSTNVRGIIECDKKWYKLKAIYIACIEAEIKIPDEVINYFEGEDPTNMEGMEIEIDYAVVESQEDSRMNYTVDLSRVPISVKKIRFTNSWQE